MRHFSTSCTSVLGDTRAELVRFVSIIYLPPYLSTWVDISLVAQLVKNPPAMQETSVQFLGQEDPLEEG